jgi:hypothetical protein
MLKLETKVILLVAAAGVCAVTLTGCGDIEAIPPGSVESTWELRPSGCQRADVDTVEVWMTPTGRGSSEPTSFQRSCDSGQLVADGLKPGRYEIRLFGIDGQGRVPFAAGPRKITVFSDQRVTAPHALLTARPASLRASWRFENGRLCGSNGVDEVTVSVYGDEGDLIRTDSFECSRGEARLHNIQPGVHRVEIIGQTGEPTRWAGSEEITFKPARTEGFDAVLKSVESPADTTDG